MSFSNSSVIKPSKKKKSTLEKPQLGPKKRLSHYWLSNSWIFLNWNILRKDWVNDMLAALNHKQHHTRISFRIKYPSIILCMYLISHPHNFICSDRRKSFEVYGAEVLSLLSLLLTIIYIYISFSSFRQAHSAKWAGQAVLPSPLSHNSKMKRTRTTLQPNPLGMNGVLFARL